MEELAIVEHEKLVAEEKWVAYITSLQNDFDDLEINKERAKRRIRDALQESVKQAIVNTTFGIMFSGGVDSSLLALLVQQHTKDFTCYTVGVEDAEDVSVSKEIAAAYGLKHKVKLLGMDEVEALTQEMVKLLGTDVVLVSVGAVEYAVSELAKQDGVTILLGGLGAEELFCGYQRHGEAMKDGYSLVHAECWKGLKGMWQRDLARDFKVMQTAGIEFRAPFLAKQVIVEGMRLHPMFKIDASNNKLIIREIAESLGLRKEFANRKKRAAQYGSGFDKALEKLAKLKGFDGKKKYLESLQ